MRIVVFGATGATGRLVVERGLRAGHDLIAAVRAPSAVAARERLDVRTADVLDAASVRAACTGADVAISCIGPTRNRAPGRLVSEGTANILRGCADAGVNRLVMQSGITLSDGAELAAPNRLGLALVRPFFAAAIADKALAERAVHASDLDWVIVRPVGLAASDSRGRYTAGPRARVSPFLPLPFADAADCLLRAAVEPAWSRQVVNVGR
jgi:uncharacterized protein YbjT (DUF2867 family)